MDARHLATYAGIATACTLASEPAPGQRDDPRASSGDEASEDTHQGTPAASCPYDVASIALAVRPETVGPDRFGDRDVYVPLSEGVLPFNPLTGSVHLFLLDRPDRDVLAAVMQPTSSDPVPGVMYDLVVSLHGDGTLAEDVPLRVGWSHLGQLHGGVDVLGTQLRWTAFVPHGSHGPDTCGGEVTVAWRWTDRLYPGCSREGSVDAVWTTESQWFEHECHPPEPGTPSEPAPRGDTGAP